jgi:hypothetical protein
MAGTPNEASSSWTGMGSERFRVEPEFAVKVEASLGDTGVLVEPASIVAKAWQHADYIGGRSPEDYALVADFETAALVSRVPDLSIGSAGLGSIPALASRRCSADPSTVAGSLPQ